MQGKNIKSSASTNKTETCQKATSSESASALTQVIPGWGRAAGGPGDPGGPGVPRAALATQCGGLGLGAGEGVSRPGKGWRADPRARAANPVLAPHSWGPGRADPSTSPRQGGASPRTGRRPAGEVTGAEGRSPTAGRAGPSELRPPPLTAAVAFRAAGSEADMLLPHIHRLRSTDRARVGSGI